MLLVFERLILMIVICSFILCNLLSTSGAQSLHENFLSCRATYQKSGDVSCLFDVVETLIPNSNVVNKQKERTYKELNGQKFRNGSGKEIQMTLSTSEDGNELKNVTIFFYKTADLNPLLTVSYNGYQCKSGDCKSIATYEGNTDFIVRSVIDKKAGTVVVTFYLDSGFGEKTANGSPFTGLYTLVED